MRNVNPACLLWLLSSMTVFSLRSLATEVSLSTEPDNVTIGQLEAIQARNLLLEQQVQTARLQRQLRESENPAATESTPPLTLPFVPPNPAGEMSGRAVAAANAQGKGSQVLRLQEIYGRGSQLRARLLLPLGGVTEVTTGDPIPGSHLRVTVVTPTTVKLSDGSELSF